MKHPPSPACPCGSGAAYGACCGRAHHGTPPADAEALMRSRYSAYVLGLADYLLATWHPTTRPPALDLAAGPQPKWLGLEVRRHERQSMDRAAVAFVARCRIGGRAQRLHETSRFVLQDGLWLYLDGETTGPA
jgi:SEC-C motif-containing protein